MICQVLRRSGQLMEDVGVIVGRFSGEVIPGWAPKCWAATTCRTPTAIRRPCAAVAEATLMCDRRPVDPPATDASRALLFLEDAQGGLERARTTSPGVLRAIAAGVVGLVVLLLIARRRRSSTEAES